MKRVIFVIILAGSFGVAQSNNGGDPQSGSPAAAQPQGREDVEWGIPVTYDQQGNPTPHYTPDAQRQSAKTIAVPEPKPVVRESIVAPDRKNPLASEQKLIQPKLLAIFFYSDSCTACKSLEPKIDAAKYKFAGQPVLFTRFDLTNQVTEEQSGLFAALLGLEQVFLANSTQTGVVLLVNPETKKVLGKITAQNEPAKIESMLQLALMGHAVSND
jgi:thiol-disulfide isomerase/thioredoxin